MGAGKQDDNDEAWRFSKAGSIDVWEVSKPRKQPIRPTTILNVDGREEECEGMDIEHEHEDADNESEYMRERKEIMQQIQRRRGK